MIKKIKWVIITTFMMGLMFSFTSLADTTISNISINIKQDKENIPAGVPYPAEIEVSSSSKYEIYDYEWSKEYDNWESGTKITANVELTIKSEYEDDYSFKDIKAHCSKGSVVSVKCDGTTATIKISYIPEMKLDAPKDIRWDNEQPGLARWKGVKGASKYNIEVLVNGEKKNRLSTDNTYYDLTSYMVQNIDNDVTFQVQAVGGTYTDTSDFALCKNDYNYGETSVEGTVKTSASGTTTAKDEDGNAITGWQQILGIWYYFDSKGVALTNWQLISGHWYYFNTDGKMLTGWQKINEVWYFLLPSGEMCTGWVQDGPNGTWYYLNEKGEMLVNTNIGNYILDSSGACINP